MKGNEFFNILNFIEYNKKILLKMKLKIKNIKFNY